MRFRPAAGRIPYRRIVAKPHSAVGAGSGVGSDLLLQCQLRFHSGVNPVPISGFTAPRVSPVSTPGPWRPVSARCQPRVHGAPCQLQYQFRSRFWRRMGPCQMGLWGLCRCQISPCWKTFPYLGCLSGWTCPSARWTPGWINLCRMAFCRPSPAGSGPARVICGRRGTGSCRADARCRGCSYACGACSDPGRRHIRRG